eukprot:g19766.t1
MLKANTPGCSIVSGNGTLCENLSDYVEGILKPIVQGTLSFCCDITDFLQKLSTYGPEEPGTFLVTMDVSALYSRILHNDGIAATASVLKTDNCQFLDAILQFIHFILDHNVFDNQFFTQTHGPAMGTRFAPQYANIFMHRFEVLPGNGETKPHSLQHINDDDENLTNMFSTPPLLTFKQLPNLRQTIVRSQLPTFQGNIDHNTIQPCHGNLCKTCQIIDMDT